MLNISNWNFSKSSSSTSSHPPPSPAGNCVGGNASHLSVHVTSEQSLSARSSSASASMSMSASASVSASASASASAVGGASSGTTYSLRRDDEFIYFNPLFFEET